MIGDKTPMLKNFKSTKQDLIWHSEGDVHIHTDMVLNETYDIISNQASYLSDDDKFCLVMAALLHDIAKPITTKEIERDNRICVVAPRHESIGMSYLIHKIQSLNISVENIKKIIGLVGYHQVPKLLVIRDKSKWDYMNLSQKARLDLLYFLEVADIKGRECYDKADQLEYLELFKVYAEENDCYDKINIPFISDNKYIQNKGFKALISGGITMPEEADAKFFKYKDNYPEIVLLSGLSGVGKSTYIKDNYKDHTIISLDEIREEVGKNRQDHSNEGRVLQKAKINLRTAFNKKQKVIYDATNLRKDFRNRFLGLGEDYNALTSLVFLTDSMSNIYKKDNDREHSVGKKVLDYQEQRLEYPEVDEADIYSIKIGGN
jgi:predicted kinase